MIDPDMHIPDEPNERYAELGGGINTYYELGSKQGMHNLAAVSPRELPDEVDATDIIGYDPHPAHVKDFIARRNAELERGVAPEKLIDRGDGLPSSIREPHIRSARAHIALAMQRATNGDGA